MKPTVNSKLFGKTAAGESVTIYTFSLENTISFSVINYGATWTLCFVPDRNGKLEALVLGFDSMAGF